MDCSLCVVTDRKIAAGKDMLKIIAESLEGGAGIIQLREKNISSRDFLKIALEIKKIFKEYKGRLFIINDRVDIALACGADGVHLGQEDMPADAARKILGPDAVIGVSVSKVSQAVKAESDGASYLGAGAVYRTPTKPGSGAIGLEGVEKISKAVKIPVIAIGGIKHENVAGVIAAGAAGVAVVSEVMACSSARCCVEKLLKKINHAGEDLT